MPKILFERFSARLMTDDARQIAVTEWVFEDGMFLVFLTVPPYTDREMVAATKRTCYVPPLMRAVLEGYMGHAHIQQYLDRNHRNVLRLPDRRGRA